ncbi:MAG: hypothetical protein E4H02_04770 [Lentisphaerales bacterium]|jgi:hypothetical protein|nr:MAG: hypothetical protein E4H02_04770 [Lentisphaerales bacterium]
MFGPKIAVSKELYEKLRVAAEAGGYSSPEEFALHILEKAVLDKDESLSEEEVKKRLKGLGYMG